MGSWLLLGLMLAVFLWFGTKRKQWLKPPAREDSTERIGPPREKGNGPPRKNRPIDALRPRSCAACGKANRPLARFCGYCGQSLQKPAVEPSCVTQHSAHPQIDPSLYPRTYTIADDWKARYLACGTLMIVVGLGSALVFLTNPVIAPGVSFFLALLFLLSAVCATLSFALAIRYCIVLTPDRVEVRKLWKTRVLRLSDISGGRMRQVNRYPIIYLIPKDKNQKPLKLPPIARVDKAFNDWLAAIPDVDSAFNNRLAAIPDQDLLDKQKSEAEVQKFEAEVAANPLDGHTPEERSHRLAYLRRITRILNVLGTALALWAWFYPLPYRPVMTLLIVFPIIGLILAWSSKGLIQIGKDANDKRPTVAGIVIIPIAPVSLSYIY